MPVQAVDAGLLGNVGAGTVTVIVNPDPDLVSVTNTAALTGGREKETDVEYRERWDLSVASGGAATIDSIRSALLRTEGVRAAIVIENYTKTVDAGGRPPSSFEAFVLGGEDAVIGQTILNTKAAGIEPFGSTSVPITDISGQAHVMRFSRAVEKPQHVRVTLTKNSAFPATGNADIASAIVRYIGGEDASGQLYTGLNMGEDVILSRLIAAAYSVSGIDDVTIELSQNGSTWTSGNAAIAPQEVAQTSFSLIEVHAA
ncbi:Baseplate J-like protein [Paenibacillus sp. UNC496MF]|uniref:baseplate J/gp47 family protein n=1 Tax=Paenibacillus sp. UNC496MF TaxID=1502753 RepID=UPI0008E94143|nr:baseplate J/gp47 family protein [Paenibacillus sp. UNC496MF]SFJ44490.1 Baseplate J-like protein [Paenibacillus sp. UNC496MF]